MTKHKSIIELLGRLNFFIDSNELQIIDYWDADLCAIGLQRKEKLAYISTYNSINNNIVKYDLDLELTGSGYNIIKKAKQISEIKLIEEIEMFFND